MTGRNNSRCLELILAALISGVALTSLVKTSAVSLPPMDLPVGSAAYRLDGGQSLGHMGSWPSNALTRLNLGYQVDIKTTPAPLLAALPGLGLKTAEKARKEGCLNHRARTSLKELVNEICDRNSP